VASCCNCARAARTAVMSLNEMSTAPGSVSPGFTMGTRFSVTQIDSPHVSSSRSVTPTSGLPERSTRSVGRSPGSTCEPSSQNAARITV